MKRFILEDLRKWRVSKYRKPLILRGARQVGKTWALKEFGKEFDNVAYFNFDESYEYGQFFETTKDVNRILQNLSFASGQKITPDTLIIFDEIQSCNSALNALKYFCENAPEYYVACAGSLLGLTLSKGFPVGKVDFLDMGPLTFSEFLLANGDENLFGYLDEIRAIEPIPDAFFNPLLEKLKMYFVTGGMPEAVLRWTQERDISLVNSVLDGILGAYEKDFGKHHDEDEALRHDVQKITLVWNSLPSQLARENKKFMYSAVKSGARAREYEDALQWLADADLVKKVFRISKPSLPVAAYEQLDSFKIYHGDVGLLRRQARLSHTAFAEGNRLFTEFKGALAENYVLQSLLRQFDAKPSYWTDTPYEVDFVQQYDNDIIPIEVKSSQNISSVSIKNYLAKYPATPLAVRLSTRNLSLDGKVLNVPLFAADLLHRLLDIALPELGAGNPARQRQ